MTQDQRILWAKRVIGVLRRGTLILQASEANWPSSLKDEHFATFVATVFKDEWKQDDFEFEEAAELLSQTGFLLTKVGRHREADELLERAVGIREKLLGPDHLGVAETLSHFANNLAEWGHNSKALPYYERALQIRMRKQGKNHPDVAQVHNDYGIAYFNILNYDEAIKHYLESKRIWEKGGEENLIGTAFFNLAMIYQKQPKMERKAEEHFRAAHAKITNQHMRAHVCKTYGEFLVDRGRDTEALPLLREGQKQAKMCFGDKSEMILKHNDSLVRVLERLGLDEFKVIERESKGIRKRMGE
jgi:tetratricopeptide (TPR) repeat protein